MNFSRFFSGLFLTLGLGLMILALMLTMALPGAKPTLLSPAADAQNQVISAMDAICRKDFSAAEQYLLGQPSLGVDREPADAAGAMIWEAFLESLSYELKGDCYATDTGVAQDIAFTCLDIPSVTEGLAQRTEETLTKLRQEATHASEIYDDSGNYHQHLVQDVLNASVRDALKEDSKTTTVTFSLQLVNRDGQWYIVPNSDFISAISGGMG